MVRRLAALIAVALPFTVAACGSSTSDSTPVACLDGPRVYLDALADAPDEVRLADEVPISDCLAANQQGGDLATVGTSMIEAATELNREARRKPGGEATGQLGYLLGAAARGAEETEGIHADLLRRLDAAARYSPAGGRPRSAAFQRAYRRGYEAGAERG